MALPGDARVVIDLPPADQAATRRGTLTMGFLDADGELGPSRTYLLTTAEEHLVELLVIGKVRGSCGPSFFS